MNNIRYLYSSKVCVKAYLLVVISLISVNCFAKQQVDLENVLGTSLSLTLYGTSAEQAKIAVNDVLEEALRLENILSTWRPGSDISRLNKNKSLENAPVELISVLDLCQQWHVKTKGAFSCRMGSVRQKWEQAAKSQVAPDRVEMRFFARDIQRIETPVKIEKNKIEIAQSMQLDPSGVAKGYVIDKLMSYLRIKLPNATGIKLDIGGDMLFWGVPDEMQTWQVGLAATHHVSDNESADVTINIPAKAVAASGHKRRYYEIERRKFSHILDPKDGWPMDNAPSAVVIAKDAATADAIATALSTQPASQGIDWVNGLDGVEAVVENNGIKVASNGWHAYMLSNPEFVAASENQIIIEYQIPNIKEGQYHRPYFALWVTDTRNKNVRHLMLLGESERWAKENTRWWRRVGRKTPGVLDAIARPTRLPGKYHLTWDSLDDNGQLVPAGKYLLHVEASREGGGHDYQKLSIDTSQFNHAITLPAKGELGQVVIRPVALENLVSNVM